jgi:hypothetical protein
MNIGAQSGLVDPKHEAAMHSSIWLYLWLVWKQTKSSGLVLGGMPLTYAEIARRSGFRERKIRWWLAVLRKAGYVEVTHLSFMKLRIRVLKSKKFNYKQQSLPLSDPLTEKWQGGCQKPGTSPTVEWQPKQSFKESKTREESKTTKSAAEPAAPVVSRVPDWIPVQTWAAFREMRLHLRRPLTTPSVDLILQKLEVLRSAGNDPVAVLEQSIRNSWSDVYELKENKNARQGRPSATEIERRSFAAAGLKYPN